MYAYTPKYAKGDEVAIITPTWGHEVNVDFGKVEKIGKNSIKLESGDSFLANGQARGAKGNRHVPYLASKEKGKEILEHKAQAAKLKHLHIEYNKRWRELDAKYPQWIPDMKEKVREFAKWFEEQEI